MDSRLPQVDHAPTDLSSLQRSVPIPTQATPVDLRGGGAPAAAPAAPLSVNSGYGRVTDSDLAPTKVERTGPVRTPPTVWHRPRLFLALQILVMLVVAVITAAAAGAAPVTTVVVVVTSLVTRFHSGKAALRPGPPHPERVVANLALPFALVGGLVAFAGVELASLRHAAALIVAVFGTDALCTVLRGRLQRPTRAIIVGDRAAIARAAARWAEDRHVSLVGGLLLNDEPDTPPISTTNGVHTIRGINEVAEWADLWVADLVVVAPGPGITSESVRRLGWLMEKSDASLSMTGVLDSVAPHRIDSTVLAGATLIHVRCSRSSIFIRGSKWAFDRVMGTARLLVAAPVLAVLWLRIQVESSGPGLFKQTRVDKDGKPFTMYKLRTMRTDAEAIKHTLARVDEGNGILFKIRDDPGITRFGRRLRARHHSTSCPS